ncbi:hypothetical protein SAMN05421664_3717 [Chryseobacterium soldanellicola]|uniref:Acetyltransferase (GNAT) domain-containing protein n=1 Tax=Chryseobacterium soldanellicola TaxID=311333 RepID=A0A1H1GJF5_9FLAO|nr:hypothetical protein [Chryseobacterium soldanellicola]SDR13372.1 hypothetical protein SAMN05421664_3717 [Chryseobacterium soldanellicola]
MIKRLKYHEINFEKYSHCLDFSEQKNWYAKKEVLDELSGNWELLICGDYEAVMPIHIKKKFGFNFVHMPLFCQQLGIFSKIDKPEINDQFLKFFKKKYKVFLYSFNHHNIFSENLNKRKNYIVPVSDYVILRRKKYFKGRKSTAKWAQHLFYKEIQLDNECFSFIESNFKGLDKKSDFEKLTKYLRFLEKKNSLKISGAYLENKLINLAILVSEPQQLSLLALFNDENFKNENGPSFLIDRILNLYIHEKRFNFMGSNIRGIELFFKSFGGELHDYCFTENKFLKIFS